MNGEDRGRIAYRRWPYGLDMLAVFRAALRFSGCCLWTLCSYVALRMAGLIQVAGRPHSKGAALRISLTWLRVMLWLTGVRLRGRGQVPSPPCLVVFNHPSWLDALIAVHVFSGRLLVEEPLVRTPLVGALLKGCEAIFVRRIREDTSRVNDCIVAAYELGHNILLSPKAPGTGHHPAREVHPFRAGLLASAARLKAPVYPVCFNYYTPPGSPSPAECMLYGPNPYVLSLGEEIRRQELQAWGPRRSFLWFLFREFALPWYTVEVCIAREPVTGTDKIVLANRLHAVVRGMFSPME